MPQYFFNKKITPMIDPKLNPILEYFCNVTPEDENLSRILHAHQHTCELIFVYAGQGVYVMDGTTYPLAKGDLILCNSGVLHEEILEKNSNLATYILGLTNLKIHNLPRNTIIPPNVLPIVNTGDEYDNFLSLFTMINLTVKENNINHYEANSLIARAILTKALTLALNNPQEKKILKPNIALQAKEYIDENFREDITLEDIAAAVQTNRFYLAHIFKKATGFTPRQYIIRRRIGEAQNLLINTTMHITKVATNVGYNNSNYFQNVFKNFVGYTPGQYRKKWRK